MEKDKVGPRVAGEVFGRARGLSSKHHTAESPPVTAALLPAIGALAAALVCKRRPIPSGGVMGCGVVGWAVVVIVHIFPAPGQNRAVAGRSKT